MTRPSRLNVTNGQQAWDTTVNDDFKIILARPFPITQTTTDESTPLTESNLAATYTASAYQNCLVWVNHSVRGYTLYRSNGTTWEIVHGATKDYERSSASGTVTVNDYDDVIVLTGTNTRSVNLEAAATAGMGRYITIKNEQSSGTVTVDGSGSETIDGSLTFSMTLQYESITLVSDGSNWHIV